MADFETLQSDVLADWNANAKWREQAKDDFAFRDGHQWTQEEINLSADKDKPTPVFNRVAVIISAVAGSEINNRTEVRFIPREIGDAKPNEVLTQGAEWFRDQAMAEDEESEAFDDLLVCGLGFTETGLDFEEDEEGAPQVGRIYPWEMCWDGHARKKGLKDSCRFSRVLTLPYSEAKDRFPDHMLQEIDCVWLEGADDGGEVHNNIPEDQYTAGREVSEKPKSVTVVQTQYCERERVVQFALPGQDRQELPKAQWEALKERMDAIGIPEPQHRIITRKVWRQAFLGANSILLENQPCEQESTFQAMTGIWDEKDGMFYGLLRAMRDPQKYANKWMQQTLHIINSNAKGGVMAEEGAVEDVGEFEASWAASDEITWVKQGAITGGQIKEKPSAQMPSSLMSLTEFAISSIRDASGVNMELLGLRDANQPGVLEYQRRQSAMTTLARFFDSLRYYRKRQGLVILSFLRDHIAPTGRLVRLLKEGQEQYVPLALADDAAKYDVIVDDAPSAPNEKEKAWSVLEAMLPMLMESGVMTLEDWADVLEYSPLPSSFVDKVREKASQSEDPQAQQMEQMQQQLAMRGMAAEVREKETQAMENEAQANLDMARAQEVGVNTQLAPAQTFADLMQPMPVASSSPV